ncbi:uncharacterized protein M6B38_271900 [Iris pallida]|uniref:Transposase-associated domain-containing protein n=1 Tax=Iris pallida TaxID=29817 RepID=A0AAX6I770_IRIPA|nr:uncharacterized protein M6B38_271900 [Iris pallida]
MNREWIKSDNRVSAEYREGIDAFIILASSQEGVNRRIRCPCNTCRNTEFKPTVEVRLHLLRNGFNKSYTTWILHGEKLQDTTETSNINCDEHLNDEIQMDDVDDLIGLVHDAYAFENVNSSQPHEEMFGETPNDEVSKFKLLKDATVKFYPRKHRLHETYKRFQTDEERLANGPSDVKSEDQKLLIEYSSSDNFQQKLHDLAIQQEADPESQLTHDGILLQVLGQKTGYFQSKGSGKRPPTKRIRYLENMHEEVRRAVESAKESMIESVKVDVMKNLLEEMRANVSNELRAEIRKTVEEELKIDLTTQIQNQFNAMFQERMTVFLGSSSQSADTLVPTNTRATNFSN